MGGVILEGFGLAGVEVEAVEDGVGEVADGRAAEQSEAVLLRFGEGEGVAESAKTYLLAMEVIILIPAIQTAPPIRHRPLQPQ